MPDWSYHPFFRPLLFRLPTQRACDLTLHALGALAALPFGTNVLQTFGHMRAPKALTKSLWGITFPSAVGLGAGFDTNGTAARAFAEFGFGFIEVGPVTCAPCSSEKPIARDDSAQTLIYPGVPANGGVDALCHLLHRNAPLPVPLGIRLAHRPNASLREITQEQTDLAHTLSAFADFFTVSVETTETDRGAFINHLKRVRQACAPRPVLLILSPDAAIQQNQSRAADALYANYDGVLINDAVHLNTNQISIGHASHGACVELTHSLRQTFGDDLKIISAGGITEPQDALDLLDAGADLVSLNSGLVYAGPGLPKRINEAQCYFAKPNPHEPKQTLRDLVKPGWFSGFMLGVWMIVGGLLVWLVAETIVVLPYDEAFVGLSRAQINGLNPNLLHFMTHDRVTLAGTMLAIGISYVMLAYFGMRRRVHWARNAFLISAVVGFSTFFLFLGFGYFDPLHALVSILLLPFFIWSMLSKYPNPPEISAPSLRNDKRWLSGIWGQAILLGVSLGLIGAGLAICFVGITGVFVPEDLEYLRISPILLRAANPNIIPLVAHDRAGFGGALISAGLAALFMTLWGFRDGARWIGWTWLFGGIAAFGATLYIHLHVSYQNPFHLAPLWAGIVFWLIGLVLAYPMLFRTFCPVNSQTT